MKLQNISTQALMAELARRVERMDHVMSALATLNGGESLGNMSYKVAPPRKAAKALPGAKTSRRLLKPEMVVEVMKAAKKPLTSRQIHTRLRKGTASAVFGQLTRLKKNGQVKASGVRPNVVWALA